jgi:hypothetical protein
MATGKPTRGGTRRRNPSSTPGESPGIGSSASPEDVRTSSGPGAGYGSGSGVRPASTSAVPGGATRDEFGGLTGTTPEAGSGALDPEAHQVSAYVTAQSGRGPQGELGSQPLAGEPRRQLLPDAAPAELIERVQDYARRHPATFLGAAFLLGLGFARFLKSSGARRRSETLRRISRERPYAGSRVMRSRGVSTYGSTYGPGGPGSVDRPGGLPRAPGSSGIVTTGDAIRGTSGATGAETPRTPDQPGRTGRS